MFYINVYHVLLYNWVISGIGFWVLAMAIAYGFWLLPLIITLGPLAFNCGYWL